MPSTGGIPHANVASHLDLSTVHSVVEPNAPDAVNPLGGQPPRWIRSELVERLGTLSIVNDVHVPTENGLDGARKLSDR